MTERGAPNHPGAPVRREDRFDAEAARRILRRAAEEQHRLETTLHDSYSRQELEEIAAETGISREAVEAAIATHRRRRGPFADPEDRPAEAKHGWIAALERWMPRHWSTGLKHVILAGIVAALFALLATLPVIGPVIVWVAVLSLMVLFVLALLGVSVF